jgi:transposase InsO family protein
MAWKVESVMEQKEEFVKLAEASEIGFRELCRRYQISPSTGYKWLERYRQQGVAGLVVRSRRPAHSPRRSAPGQEAQVVQARQAHPAWGARKLKRWLENHGQSMPSASTVQAILQRHGCIGGANRPSVHPWQRFEHAAANDLWQMDFKGHFAVGAGRCHPLTILDDHSRYGLCLKALAAESLDLTQQGVIETFRRYGLPRRMTMDNGSPWGERGRYTRFELWLMRLDIGVGHSRPYHPQTQGKDERFHRTLKAEVLQDRAFSALTETQQAFDRWLPIYNLERPHEALSLALPVSRYRPSERRYPETLPALFYDQGVAVRTVQKSGEFNFRGKEYVLGKAFGGERIGVRPTAQCDDIMEVCYGRYVVATLSCKDQTVWLRKGT